MRDLSRNDRFWVILILLLAFFLRVYALADVAIDNDESYEYNRWISESFKAIAMDDLILNSQAPAYLLSRASLLVLGDTLFSLRWPSAALSVLAVAVMYRLARLLFNRRVSLAGALLLAVSPYAVFLAHTLRGYSGILALSLLVYLLALLALRTGAWQYWLGLALAAAAMLYTHLFSVVALANLVLLLVLLRAFGPLRRAGARPRPGRPALLSLGLLLALVMLAYAPLWTSLLAPAPNGETGLDRVAWVQRPQVPASVWHNLLWFNGLEKGSFGPYVAPVFLALALLGMWVGWTRGKRAPLLFVAGWAWLPFLEVWLAGAVLDRFWARPSYLVFALPPLLLLVALLLAQLPAYWRSRQRVLLAAGSGLALWLALFWSLTLVEFYTVFAGGNWLAVANFLQQQTGPNDLVICQPYDHAWRDVDIDAENNCTRSLNYRRKAGMAMIAPVSISHALVYGGLPEANAGVINRLGRVWLVVWDVPETAPLPAAEGLAVTEFNGFGRSLVVRVDGQPTYLGNLAHALDALRATTHSPEQQFVYSLMIAPLAAAGGQNDLAGAALAEAAGLLPDHPDSRPKLARTEQLVRSLSKLSVQHPLQANFGDRIMLVGYSLSSEQVKPGSALDLTLFWQALQPVVDDYSVFLHVRDRTGRTVAQFDYQPYDGNYPTRLWQPGQWLADPQQLPVPPDFPPGEYELLVGFYDPDSLARLPLVNDQSGENALRLALLRVQ